MGTSILPTYKELYMRINELKLPAFLRSPLNIRVNRTKATAATHAVMNFMPP